MTVLRGEKVKLFRASMYNITQGNWGIGYPNAVVVSQWGLNRLHHRHTLCG